MPAPDVSLLVLFDADEGEQILARVAAAESTLADRSAHEVVVVGHGSSDVSSAVAKRILAVRPDLRLLLHARPCSADEALFAGVDFADGRALVLLDRDARGRPPILIERQQFLALPRIRGISRYLPRWLAVLCRLAGASSIAPPRVVP